MWSRPSASRWGVTNAWTWAREFKRSASPRGGVLESVRWVESYERIAEQTNELPGTRHVCIGDRESDILALLVMARKMNHAADYLVRCQHNRVLPEGASCWMTSWPARRWGISALRCRPGGRKARAVEQEVCAQRVVLPDRQGGQIEVTCLIASEINAPAGAKPVVWRLLSDLKSEL